MKKYITLTRDSRSICSEVIGILHWRYHDNKLLFGYPLARFIRKNEIIKYHPLYKLATKIRKEQLDNLSTTSKWHNLPSYTQETLNAKRINDIVRKLHNECWSNIMPNLDPEIYKIARLHNNTPTVYNILIKHPKLLELFRNGLTWAGHYALKQISNWHNFKENRDEKQKVHSIIANPQTLLTLDTDVITPAMDKMLTMKWGPTGGWGCLDKSIIQTLEVLPPGFEEKIRNNLDLRMLGALIPIAPINTNVIEHWDTFKKIINIQRRNYITRRSQSWKSTFYKVLRHTIPGPPSLKQYLINSLIPDKDVLFNNDWSAMYEELHTSSRSLIFESIKTIEDVIKIAEACNGFHIRQVGSRSIMIREGSTIIGYVEVGGFYNGSIGICGTSCAAGGKPLNSYYKSQAAKLWEKHVGTITNSTTDIGTNDPGW